MKVGDKCSNSSRRASIHGAFSGTMSLPFICVSVRVAARTSADSTHCPTIAFTFARHMNIPGRNSSTPARG
ncbi:hypothetical protein EYF80_021015 [Liparis tanakae]|uniref:Uncharacterized protein n=1 Tax=Liparis tanakae TaxID=230148 RepID=A0A4Z2HSZ0_9TELE|nr:hypothetical protein EYF80_021015 [Liparis tanakae]